MIVSDPQNPRAKEMHAALESNLSAADQPEDLVIAIGGDGFLLRTISNFGLAAVYMGINAGSLGFLLNDIHKDWETISREIKNGLLTTYSFPLVRAEIQTEDGKQHTAHAVNDIYLERSSEQTGQFAVTVDQHLIVEKLVADGIIFASALGSTAYAFSSGGPACHRSLQILNVTPICPHKPKLAPLVLPAEAVVSVDVLAPEKRPVRAVADGRAIEGVRTVTIGLGPEVAKLAYLPGHDFTAQMVEKILHP
jgi:NAD+ kinase